MKKLLDKTLDFPFKNWVVASLIGNLVFLLAIVILQKQLPPQVPLLYGLAEGEEQLVPKLLFGLPNLLALITIILNVGLSLLIKDLFIKKILIVTSITATFLAIITCLKVFFLVGSF